MTQPEPSSADNDVLFQFENDWQCEADLRRARQIVAAAKVRGTAPIHSPLAQLATRISVADSIEMPLTIPLATRRLSDSQEIQSQRPHAVPLARWNPIIFAMSGLLGGTLAVVAQQVFPQLFPAILLVEIGVGILLAMSTSPRQPFDTSAAAQ